MKASTLIGLIFAATITVGAIGLYVMQSAPDSQRESLLNLVIVCGLICGLITVYVLGALPGSIASERRHPAADAINVCAIVGLFIWPLWFVALIWAHTVPKPPTKTNPFAAQLPDAEGEQVRAWAARQDADAAEFAKWRGSRRV